MSCFLTMMPNDKIEISRDNYRRDSDLVAIAYINGQYFIHNDKGYMWKVIKSNKRHGKKAKSHRLQKGDQLKLGRFIFEVRDISSKNVKNPNQSMDNTEIDYQRPFGRDRGNIPRTTTIATALDYVSCFHRFESYISRFGCRGQQSRIWRKKIRKQKGCVMWSTRTSRIPAKLRWHAASDMLRIAVPRIHLFLLESVWARSSSSIWTDSRNG